jgi:hypothetical protein
MIAGGPLSNLKDFHEILTNIPSHPREREDGGSVIGGDIVSCEKFPPFFVRIS